MLMQNANCCVLVNEDTYKTSSGSAVFEKICSIKVKGRDDKIKVPPCLGAGLYWALLGFIGLYWALLGFIGRYWALLGFIGFYWALLGWVIGVCLAGAEVG